MPGFDFYFVPTVLNSTDVAFHNGTLLEALKTYGHKRTFSRSSIARCMRGNAHIARNIPKQIQI